MQKNKNNTFQNTHLHIQSVYQNKLPAFDDFLATFLMKAKFILKKIHIKLLEIVTQVYHSK